MTTFDQGSVAAVVRSAISLTSLSLLCIVVIALNGCSSKPKYSSSQESINTYNEMRASREKESIEKRAAMRDSVRAVVRARVKALQKCYEKRLNDRPDLSGKIVFRWEILETGKVNNPKAIQSIDPLLEKCMASEILEWEFEKSSDGKIHVIDYPFVFRK